MLSIVQNQLIKILLMSLLIILLNYGVYRKDIVSYFTDPLDIKFNFFVFLKSTASTQRTAQVKEIERKYLFGKYSKYILFIHSVGKGITLSE